MNLKPSLQPSLTDPSEKIMELFKSIHKIFRDQICERTKQFGFTPAQMTVIFHLHQKPCITLHELSELMGLSKSTVSGIIDRLVNHGVVNRQIPEDNRRIVKLSLSEKFVGKYDLMELKKKIIAGVLENASPENIKLILSGLEMLLELLHNSKDADKSFLSRE